MAKFVVRRIVWTIPVILLVIFITFMMMREIAGNPFRTSERAVPESIQRNLDAKYGLNDPWYEQYFRYVKGVFTYDLGPSLVLRNRDVNDIIETHLPKSAELGLYGFLFGVVVGIPLGVLSALRANTVFDYGAMFFSNLGFAIPNFLRATMLETLQQDYVRTAKAKGLRWRRVVGLHVLRNSLIPVVTAAGPLFGLIITGTFIIEVVFAIPGIGRYFITAVNARDYSVVMGITVLTAIIVIVANLVVDLLYGVLDPRTREART